MDAPFARHLARFSAPPVLARAAVVAVPQAAPEPSVTMTAAAYEAQLRAATRAAHEAASAEGAALLSQRSAEHAAALSDAVAAAEARCAVDAGGAIAMQIAAAFGTLGEEIATQVADALRPLLKEAVVRRTVAAVGDTLARAIGDPDHPPLDVRGPAPLLAAVEEALGTTSGVSFSAGHEDIVVTGNNIRIEARLARALAAIADEEQAP